MVKYPTQLGHLPADTSMMPTRRLLILVLAAAASDALQLSSRRATVAAAIVAASQLKNLAPALAEDVTTELLSPPLPLPPLPSTDMSYTSLSKLLIECRETGTCTIERVEFNTPSGEEATVVLRSGTSLPISGIPKDDPNSDSSPYKLVARLRDARVPYTFPFSQNLAKYRKS